MHDLVTAHRVRAGSAPLVSLAQARFTGDAPMPCMLGAKHARAQVIWESNRIKAGRHRQAPPMPTL